MCVEIIRGLLNTTAAFIRDFLPRSKSFSQLRRKALQSLKHQSRSRALLLGAMVQPHPVLQTSIPNSTLVSRNGAFLLLFLPPRGAPSSPSIPPPTKKERKKEKRVARPQRGISEPFPISQISLLPGGIFAEADLQPSSRYHFQPSSRYLLHLLQPHARMSGFLSWDETEGRSVPVGDGKEPPKKDGVGGDGGGRGGGGREEAAKARLQGLSSRSLSSVVNSSDIVCK